MSRRLALRRGGTPLAVPYERKRDRIVLGQGDRRFEAEVKREGFWFMVRSGESTTRCAIARGRRQLWLSCEGRTYVFEEDHPGADAKAAAHGGAACADDGARGTGRGREGRFRAGG